MGSLRLVAIVVVLLVAGCAGDPSDAGGNAPAGTSDQGIAPAVIAESPSSADALVGDAAVAVDVPIWQLGDAWSITTFGDDGEERAFLVVTRADADNYVVETTSEQMAGYDAMFDVSYLGNIRARDLAGSQQGNPVQYFSFPLTNGKTWTTRWDGYDVALTATKSARGFDIVGTVDGEAYVRYDFVPDLRWWSKLEFVGESYGIRVDRAESGWKGEVVAATAEIVYEASPVAPVASPNTGAFTIGEGQSYGLVTVRGGGSQYVHNFLLIDPAGTLHPGTLEGELMGPREVRVQQEIPATPGEWRVSAPGVHDPSGGFWLTVHQVAIAKKAFA